MTWHPISDAPKDGTSVDLWAETHEFANRALGETRKITARFIDCYWGSDINAWRADDGDAIESNGWRITHFMLSPNPPEPA